MPSPEEIDRNPMFYDPKPGLQPTEEQMRERADAFAKKITELINLDGKVAIEADVDECARTVTADRSEAVTDEIVRLRTALEAAESRAEKAEQERDYLVSEYERAVKCGPNGYIHAADHIYNAIVNAKCDANADRFIMLSDEIAELRKLAIAAEASERESNEMYWRARDRADAAKADLAKWPTREEIRGAMLRAIIFVQPNIKPSEVVATLDHFVSECYGEKETRGASDDER